MQAEDKITIMLNTDSKKIAACARMMTQSDPWITLGMDYSHCLKAFDGLGPCKEMYVIEVGDQLAGFVVLQLCGTFKGYIQTICMSEDYRGKGLGKSSCCFVKKRFLKSHRTSSSVFLLLIQERSNCMKRVASRE